MDATAGAIGENGRMTDWSRLTRPTGPVPRPLLRNWLFDVALALALGAGAAVYIAEVSDIPDRIGAPNQPGLSVWLGLVTLLAVGALVFRRRYPLAVLWIVLGAALLTPPGVSRLVFYPCVVAAYSAAAYSPYRVPTLASLAAAVVVAGLGTDDIVPTVPSQYAPFLVLVPIIVAANGLRTWKFRVDAGLEQLSELERRRALELRSAVEHERARIARELHDVVTHNVSMMTIQAGAARKIMATEPEQAREALLAVEAGGRTAMAELRHVMGLLTMADGGPDLTPQPGLDQVDALVARVRETGAEVGLAVTGQPRAVPSGIGLAAYRVVQEALTNTMKHAAGAAAAVTVDYGADRLRVEVTDTGGRRDPAAATGNGRGLIGLRERLDVYGGTLRAGRRLGGGYRIEALIPLEEP